MTLTAIRPQAQDQVSYSDEDITDRILGAIAVFPRDARYLASLFPRDYVDRVVKSLTVLEEVDLIVRSPVGAYKLVDPSEVKPKPEIPALKDLTIQIPLGILRDLKRYSKSQGTSVEMEAAHLLGEIIRVYKAQSVIPTT